MIGLEDAHDRVGGGGLYWRQAGQSRPGKAPIRTLGRIVVEKVKLYRIAAMAGCTR